MNQITLTSRRRRAREITRRRIEMLANMREMAKLRAEFIDAQREQMTAVIRSMAGSDFEMANPDSKPKVH